MRRETDMVTAHMTFTLRIGEYSSARRRCASSGVAVQVRMRYMASDPHAVHLRFSSSGAADVDWVFARCLLADGLQQQTGQGDVRVAPRPASRGALIAIELTAPGGVAVCEASAVAIAAFLRDSEQLVPIGAEPPLGDLDTALSALLTAGEA